MKTIELKWIWGTSYLIFLTEGTGSIEVQIDPRFEDAWICDLAVHPDDRCKGYGKQLVKAAVEKIREEGISYGSMKVEKDKRWLIDWYKDQGFVELKEEEQTEEDYVFLRIKIN